ncbi:peptidase domain-containing ABC transporter [Flavobacteriaceae bacterium]|jgi:NHLM bacteriocin system ABC transporter peptidase/ATP-binding protein|nr:peptidase domain-containing ABC transporter [Flavobacteriaceae bacterium]
MRRTPVFLESSKGESGAICLAMVLGHFGSFPKLNIIKSACSSNGNEILSENLYQTAIAFGFNAKHRSNSFEEISGDSPVIVKLKGNKYVLITKEHNNFFIIHDPEKGIKRVKKKQLKSSFDHWYLQLTPNDEFKIVKQNNTFINELTHRIKPNLKGILFVLISGLILLIPAILIPSFNKLFFDDIVILNQKHWFYPMLSILGVFVIFGCLLVYLQQSILLKVELKSSVIESTKFVIHVFKLPYNYFFNHSDAETIKRIALNDSIATLLTRQLITTLLSIITIVFYGIVMLKYNWLLSIVGVAIMLFNFFALRYFSHKRTALNQSLFKKQQLTFNVATNGIKQIETLKASGAENDFFALWSSHLISAINDDQKLGIENRILAVLPEFISQINNVVILFLGGLLIISGEITIGVFLALQSFISNFSSPVENVVNFAGEIQLNKSNINHLLDTTQEPIDVFCDDNLKETIEEISEKNSKLSGNIEVKNISFGYNKFSTPLINNFSLSAYPGKRIALVGGSGSGKSTLLKVLSGLYTPLSGEINYDDKPLHTLNKDVFRNSVSIVEQDSFFFTGTILDNITMWNRSIDSSIIIKAAKDAKIHNIVSQRDGGYDSKVAPGGKNFSGGQKQRLDIARSLATEPSILFLDEATSALDTETEKFVMNNFLKRSCTTITIAHRLSTIKDFDEIIVLEKGEVVQRGDHNNLIKDKTGLYYNLLKNS